MSYQTSKTPQKQQIPQLELAINTTAIMLAINTTAIILAINTTAIG